MLMIHIGTILKYNLNHVIGINATPWSKGCQYRALYYIKTLIVMHVKQNFLFRRMYQSYDKNW